MLESVEVQGVRNLSGVNVPLSAGATALFGANGSGKTSFLEAIYLLGVGRSFRTHQSRPMIQHGAEYCRVVGRLREQGRSLTMGIEKYRDGGAKARLQGEPVSSLSDLAQQLPLILVETDGLGLLTGPPEGRRRLLDGTLFHVEHGFLGAWRRYAQAIRQRNAGLRRGILDGDGAWREELARTGEQLTAARAVIARQLGEKLREIAPQLSDDLKGVELVFRPGWDRRETLAAALDKSAETDKVQGFTRVGPHRADIKLTRDGVLVSEVLSRGQMKLMFVAIKLAQGKLIEALSHRAPLYLIDDLPAELDRSHRAAVCTELGTERQVVLTAVDRESLEAAWGGYPLELFHVEQGVISPC
ncbi:DNA replication/repair protein RecF [Luminiphilus sp.]|jgi:DNA replication and repair protein RecF|nr:DNA replication/repair protein RecF [Luminiphilus sp.]MDA8677531.1 DNA replication/repair protein RecF [Luminiphilus sp.]MDA9219454.1 DNA replication/repair protein RecF [Luminiphilus sp.]